MGALWDVSVLLGCPLTGNLLTKCWRSVAPASFLRVMVPYTSIHIAPVYLKSMWVYISVQILVVFNSPPHGRLDPASRPAAAVGMTPTRPCMIGPVALMLKRLQNINLKLSGNILKPKEWFCSALLNQFSFPGFAPCSPQGRLGRAGWPPLSGAQRCSGSYLSPCPGQHELKPKLLRGILIQELLGFI